MPIKPYKYFLPADAARMSKLQLAARGVVEGVITGRHKSSHRGFSVEFTEHRDYSPGDELRHLDWRAYARSDRYYIKLFAQETNLRATIVMDNSASMKFANKFEYARRLAACLAYLLATQQDLAGLAAVDNSVQVEIAPGSTPAHLDRLFRALENLEPGAGTDLAGGLHTLADKLPRRGLVLIISDLWLTDLQEFSRALQHLRYRRHQAAVLHLLDRAEIDLPFGKEVALQDLETLTRVQVDPADIRETYAKQVAEHLRQLRKTCSDSDVEYSSIFVDQPYDKALIQWIARR